MTLHTTVSKTFVFAAILILVCGAALADNTEQLTGTWTGELEVGHGKILDTASILSVNDDNKLKGIFRMIGQGDAPADSVSVNGNEFILIVNAGPFTIKGMIDREKDTIDAALIQGDNNIPLLLKKSIQN